MKLKKLHIKNFRTYQNITIPFDGEFNVIVGKNDIGKSTILEALAIFFEHETIKLEINDLCINADKQTISIGCVFEVDREKKYNIDSTQQASLQDEFLLNSDGLLEVWKEWDCSKSMTAKSPKIFFKANYLEEFAETPLINLKNSELKIIYDKRNLGTCKDKKINAQLRCAIYQSIENQNKRQISIDTDKEDGKKVWNYLKEEIPLYFLFQSDRANQDSDKDVQNPLKVITKKAVSEVESQLNNITNAIKAKIDDVAKQTIEKLKEMAPEVANHLSTNISTKSWDSLFSFSFEDDRGISINKRGSGVRRLILLNYFRAEAERKNTTGRSVIYSIEEPETSQHPNHQLILFDALKKISEDSENQVIITTHTPEFAKRALPNNLIFLKKTDQFQPEFIHNETKMEEIANTLGILPYLKKVVVCVEGENDINFLKNINNNIPELKSIIDLEKVTFIPMIGSNLTNWVNKHYLKETNVKEYHLYDSDHDYKYQTEIDTVNIRSDGSKAKLTSFLSMENYCPPSLIESEFNIFIEDTAKKQWGKTNIINLLRQKNTITHSDNNLKKIISGKLSSQITKLHLENEINCWEEVKGWFTDIKELFEAH
ncbi:ATP-binding protein [Legionella pneumophila]|uniref:ATP-binding protein n=1 Tax=Legionella pneumophila TaxID=446 RepID=UPI0007707CAC|nr:ATP-binding protein [Legionella pneumophila]CZO83560.1 recombination protein F [Legionella pneumophila]